jgi:hypothetical protein
MSDIEPPLRQFQAIVHDDPALQSDPFARRENFMYIQSANVSSLRGVWGSPQGKAQ